MTRTAEPVADTVLSNAVPPATPAGAPDDANLAGARVNNTVADFAAGMVRYRGC